MAGGESFKLPTRQELGRRIKARRLRLGMTQEDLADVVGRYASQVSVWERGVSYPDRSIMGDLCDALGVEPEELFGERGTESENLRSIKKDTLAANLRRLMARRGISTQSLARSSGLTSQAIYYLRRGDHAPTPSSISMLARALGMTVEELTQELYKGDKDGITDRGPAGT